MRLHGEATPLRVALPAALAGPLSTDAASAFVYAPLTSGAARVNLATGTIEVFKPAANISQIWPSPNGKGAIAEMREGGALVFDDKVEETGAVRLSGPLSIAAFSEDGGLAAIGSSDGGVRLLALATGQLISDIRSEIGSILKLSFAGQWLMIGGVDGAEAVAVDPIAALCSRIHRQMPQDSWRRVGGGGKPPTPCGAELDSAWRMQAR